MKNINFYRKNYGEIDLTTLNHTTRHQVENLVELAAKSIDANIFGSWDFGAEFDPSGSGVGEALSWSLYGMGNDYHSNNFICIVQIRHYKKEKTYEPPKIRRNFFFLERKGDNSVFVYPVNSKVVHDLIKRKKDILLALQSHMFQYDYKHLKRFDWFVLIPAFQPEKLNFQDVRITSPYNGRISGRFHIDRETIHVLDPHVSQSNQPKKIEKGFFILRWGLYEPIKKYPSPVWSNKNIINN